MPSEPVTIVLVGETGVGKSTTTQLFTNEDVPTSDETESKTKEITIYQCNTSNTRSWMDSQGTSDSDNQETDYQILIKTLKKLVEVKRTNIKVLWLIPKADRSRSEFQKQANFINILKPGDIWKSVIIIAREGRTIRNIKCAVDVAKQHGLVIEENDENNNIINNFNYGHFKWNENAFGLTLFELLDEDDYIKEDAQDMPQSRRFQRGWFKKSEAKQKILEYLSNIPPVKVPIKTNEQCNKCGQKGDRRLFDINCHSVIEYYHPSPVLQHANGMYHPSTTSSKHTRSTSKSYYHSSKESVPKYHPGTKIWFHPGFLKIEGIFAQWSCCHSFKRSEEGCKRKYTCCKKILGPFQLWSEGCTSRGYRCSNCKKSMSSEGCHYNETWDCCNKSYSSSGCTSYYPCCDSTSNYGCRLICCGQRPGQSSGCKYLCCNTTNSYCKKRCRNCRGEWGKQPVSGECRQGENQHNIVIV